jgi:hypothetical protein
MYAISVASTGLGVVALTFLRRIEHKEVTQIAFYARVRGAPVTSYSLSSSRRPGLNACV